MAIRMFKVISGEFIIGETERDIQTSAEVLSNGCGYIIKSPMLVTFQPHPSGQLAINMFPFNPFASSKNEEIKLSDQHIMFECSDVQDGLEKEYMRITSGIISVGKPMPNIKLV